jgi:large subunit ribosomal protein L28
MKKCYISGVGRMFGRSHTHHRGVAGGRWKKRAQKTNRTFEPNLQKVLIYEGGEVKRVNLATKVIKRVKFDIARGTRPKVEIIKLMPETRRRKILDADKASIAARAS